MPTKLRSEKKSKKHTKTAIDFEFVSDAIVRQAVQILGPLDGQKILVCVGKGKTGAVALAAAAKLIRDGARPEILLAETPDELNEDGKLFLKQVDTLRIPVRQWSPNLPATTYDEQDLLIDALLGSNTKGDPRYPLDQIISSMNGSRVPALALDVPSGLDPATGKPGKPTVVAMVTLQISIPTEKLLDKAGALFVGKVVPVS